MNTAFETSSGIRFGRFQVVPHRRELLVDGQPVKLGGRAFDVLMVLIEAPGTVIDKDELMRRVWPERVVEENNLQVQISTLRAAFGPQRQLIRTVAGRGYQFTGDIEGASATPPARTTAARPASALPPTNLPAPITELIGREKELADILRLATAHRLVTVTGTGGIGKTQLALAAARRLLPQFADGIWLVDLAPLTDPELVPTTVAAAAGLDIAGGAVSPERVAEALRGKRVLIVLDNCEHLVDAAARMAEALLHAGPTSNVIATSRELFRAEGEWVYQVPALPFPFVDVETKDTSEYGAVQLFAERARAGDQHFATDKQVWSAIGAICRRLDGIPLAIELVAAHAASLGIDVLQATLDDHFQLLKGGRRTALPRHQTLRATFDWSFGLVGDPERTILRRLSIFAGSFTIEAAGVIAASSEFPHSQIINGLANLIAKSLVSAEGEDAVGRYRLLETTRVYALEKLSDSGEREQVARRHAEYFRSVFEGEGTNSKTHPDSEWLADRSRHIDNLRAALDWAFSPVGDASIAVALTVAAIPLWMSMSLPEECRSRVEQALTAAGPADKDALREMKLLAALGQSLQWTKLTVPEIGQAYTQALKAAETLNDVEHQLLALVGLWLFHTFIGRHRHALELSHAFIWRVHAQGLALGTRRADPSDSVIGECMIASSHHLLGDQTHARRHIDRALSDSALTVRKSYLSRFLVDPRLMGRVSLARIQWLEGFPDTAIRTAETICNDAKENNHAVSLWYALAVAACPIALWNGDLAVAEHYVGMLLEHSARHSLPLWRAVARRHEGVLLIRRGDLDGGLRLLGSEGARPFLFYIGEMALGLGRAGQTADALALITEAIGQSASTEERWIKAELLRIQGELLLLQDGQRFPEAEAQFRKALDWSHREGTLSWELRAATSLARLLLDQGRATDARASLEPVHDRFTEGFNTADLKAARALLDALR